MDVSSSPARDRLLALIQGTTAVPKSVAKQIDTLGLVPGTPWPSSLVPGTPFMRGPLSSADGADFALRASRTSPFAVGFGRSGPSQTCPRTNWLCNPQHIL